ncbi:MAG: GDP-L-fucose synthase, partial [Alphaproteobacteria bacterium]
ADALVHLARHYSDEPHVNVGTGSDLPIAQLAETIARVIGYQGRFVYDRGKPDGAPQKLLDVSRLTALGWKAATPLADGLSLTYRWYTEQHAAAAQ